MCYSLFVFRHSPSPSLGDPYLSLFLHGVRSMKMYGLNKRVPPHLDLSLALAGLLSQGVLNRNIRLGCGIVVGFLCKADFWSDRAGFLGVDL